MPKPGFVQTLGDKLHVLTRGGLRVRVWFEDGKLHSTKYGRSNPISPERLQQIVLDLNPDAPGTIDFYPDNGRVRCEVSGELADDSFPQRLRNIVVNHF